LEKSSTLHARRSFLLLGAGIAVLVGLTYHSLTQLTMLGWDGWPLVQAGQLTGPGSLLGTFGEELMEGRYPFGHFYRPVTHLAFGLDHALYGLDPAGYHRTDLVLVALTAILLVAFAQRQFSRGALAVGAIAAAIFVLHPIQLEILAASARRADTLALLFTLACLWSQPRRGERPGHGGALLSALFAALALGSKETGAVVAPLVIGLHFFSGGAPVALPARLLRALRASVPALVGMGLMLGMRTAVLGGLGGHVPLEGFTPTPVPATELVWELLERVFLPQPLLTGTLGQVAIGTTALGMIALAVFLTRHARGDSNSPGDEPPTGRADGHALAFLAWWGLCLFAITSLADRMHDWYAMLFVAPYALALGLLAVRGLELVRGPSRVLGSAALGLSVVLAASHLGTSHLFRSYPLLVGASKLAEQNYRELTRMIEAAEEGQVVQLNPWFYALQENADGSDVRGLQLTWDYTIQAWCELHWPDRTFEVSRFVDRGLARKPGVLSVQLVPGVIPSWARDR